MIPERPPGHIEVYRDRAGEFRFRVVSSNGRIVASSSEGYSALSGAHEAVSLVLRIFNHPAVEIKDVDYAKRRR